MKDGGNKECTCTVTRKNQETKKEKHKKSEAIKGVVLRTTEEVDAVSKEQSGAEGRNAL